MPKPDSFERSLLRDADVRFGFENYELLLRIGAFVRQLRDEGVASEGNGADKLDISRIEAAEMGQGPSLLTLVRLAHAAGKRLVIGLEDADGDNLKPQFVVRL